MILRKTKCEKEVEFDFLRRLQCWLCEREINQVPTIRLDSSIFLERLNVRLNVVHFHRTCLFEVGISIKILSGMSKIKYKNKHFTHFRNLISNLN